LAIERAQLVETARAVELLQVTERLQRALLDSVSHELRTPLVTISGALSVLEEDPERLDQDSRRSLIAAAREEADRLNRLVANLLNMTRLEAGGMRLTLEDADVEDLVGAALDALGARGQGRRIDTHIREDLPMVRVDFVLMVQVLVNVLDNALKYSPPNEPIDIAAEQGRDVVCVRVDDRGPGIPSGDLDRIFDKFYRIERPGSVTGTGLGLSICRGILDAHGGRIWASDRPGGGTSVTVELPESKEQHTGGRD
jgi:two-component system sensor histidine kinase KdpD